MKIYRTTGLLCCVGIIGCFSGFDGSAKTPKSKKNVFPGAPTSAPAKRAEDPADANKKEKQTYAQAWSLICTAEARAGVDPKASRAERGAAVASWIVPNLKNKAARYWFVAFGRVERGKREAIFRASAKRAGIKQCPLAELLFEKGPTKTTPESRPSTP